MIKIQTVNKISITDVIHRKCTFSASGAVNNARIIATIEITGGVDFTDTVIQKVIFEVMTYE